MNKNDLISKTQTTQCKLICIDLLSNGLPHSRQEMISYIISKQEEYGFPEYSKNAIDGGIKQAVNSPNCERIDTGTYKMMIVNNENFSIYHQFQDICDNAIAKFMVLARGIDFVTAGEEEEIQLKQIKDCISKLKQSKDNFTKSSFDSETDYFFCNSRNADAKAIIDGRKVTVLKGSKAADNITPSFNRIDLRHSRELREKLIKDGVIDSNYYFARDYTFNNPSEACCVILGRSANGKEEWKNINNKSINDLNRNI